MEEPATDKQPGNDGVIQELIELERKYYFEKRNVKTERQRKVKELVERYTPAGEEADDS